MPLSALGTILCFTRPWDAPRFLRLSRGLKASAGDSRTLIRHLTIWEESARWLERRLEPGEEVVRLLPLLQAASLDPDERARLAALANDLETWSGTPLATMVAAERYLPEDRDNREAFALRHLQVLERLIPDRSVLVSNAPDHLCYWLACDLVRWRGGHFFGLGASGRPSGRTQVFRDASRLWLPREPTQEHRDEAHRQVEEIRSGVQPDYMKIRVPARTWPMRIRWRRTLLKERGMGNYFVTPTHLFGRGSELRISGADRRWRQALQIMEPRSLGDLTRPFIYLPLHMEPEASTWVWSAHLRDQGFLIETLARALPCDVDLVIKENPKMHGVRAVDFYRRSRHHPGVIWVDPSTPSKDLMERSEVVISLTGTACLEALITGHSAAVVGSPPYASVIQDVPQIRDLASLPSQIRALLTGEPMPPPERILEHYSQYIANLIPVSGIPNGLDDDLDMPIMEASDAFASFFLDALKSEDGDQEDAVVGS